MFKREDRLWIPPIEIAENLKEKPEVRMHESNLIPILERNTDCSIVEPLNKLVEDGYIRKTECAIEHFPDFEDSQCNASDYYWSSTHVGNNYGFKIVPTQKSIDEDKTDQDNSSLFTNGKETTTNDKNGYTLPVFPLSKSQESEEDTIECFSAANHARSIKTLQCLRMVKRINENPTSSDSSYIDKTYASTKHVRKLHDLRSESNGNDNDDLQDTNIYDNRELPHPIQPLARLS